MAWNTDKRLLWVVHINGKRYPNEKDYGYRADSKQEAIYMALKESDNIFGHLYFGGL